MANNYSTNKNSSNKNTTNKNASNKNSQNMNNKNYSTQNAKNKNTSNASDTTSCWDETDKYQFLARSAGKGTGFVFRCPFWLTRIPKYT